MKPHLASLLPLLFLPACTSTQIDPRSSTIWTPPIVPAAQSQPSATGSGRIHSTTGHSSASPGAGSSVTPEPASPYDAKPTPAPSPLRHDTPDKPLYSR